MPTRVLIVDDSGFMRRLLRGILEEDFEVVGEAETGAEAVEAYHEHDPDVVTMDIVMPDVDGIEATARIKQSDPEARIVMCTSVSQREKMQQAVDAGADSYITKPFDEPDVLSAVGDVA
ncbi:response regulator [Salinirubrum litoreum]|uniref:Response regulator n=1 Tax=Salinirubrum litoreum TaxID=1126234 RepID=A0ABD5R7Y3_9EURY|nr:response regulator [Salinirubrum litoreum]